MVGVAVLVAEERKDGTAVRANKLPRACPDPSQIVGFVSIWNHLRSHRSPSHASLRHRCQAHVTFQSNTHTPSWSSHFHHRTASSYWTSLSGIIPPLLLLSNHDNRMIVFSDSYRNKRRCSVNTPIYLQKKSKWNHLTCAASIQVHSVKHNCHEMPIFINPKACR